MYFRTKLKGRLKIFLFDIIQVGPIMMSKIITIGTTIRKQSKKIKFAVGIKVCIVLAKVIRVSFPMQKPEINQIHGEGAQDQVNLKDINYSIDRAQSGNQNIWRVTEIVFWIIMLTFYGIKLVLKKHVPLGNNLKIGNGLVACINYVPNRVPINPNRLLKPTLPGAGAKIDFCARNRNLLVMSPNPIYQDAMVKLLYQRQIEKILVHRGGELFSAETWELMSYTANVAKRIIMRNKIKILAHLLAWSGYKKESYILRLVSSIVFAEGFALDPSDPIRLLVTVKQNDMTPINFTRFEEDNIVYQFCAKQISKKFKHLDGEFIKGESRLQTAMIFVRNITQHEDTEIHSASIRGKPGCVAMFKNSTHNLGILYGLDDSDNNGTNVIFKFISLYNFTKTQMERFDKYNKVQ